VRNTEIIDLSERPTNRTKFRPNPRRQIILVALALLGLAAGYGLGYVFKPTPPEKPKASTVSQQQPRTESAAKTEAAMPVETPQTHKTAKPTAPRPILPEPNTITDGEQRAYEEALPKEIVVTVKRLAPPTPAPKPAPEPTAKPATKPAMEVKLNALEPTPERAVKAMSPAPPSAHPAMHPAARPPKNPETWQRHAVAVKTDGRPKIAIVFDDLGVDKGRTRRAIQLKRPLSMSFLSYANHLAAQTKAAKEAGHELWMHVPMEPSAKSVDPGPNVLLSGLDPASTLKSLRWNLDQFTGYVGINNHMGSRFTADVAGMRQVMGELRVRGLAFLDSLTSGKSAGRRSAREADVPFAIRNIFIDHEDDIAVIRGQLAKIEKLAREQGHAIAIGHPREATLKAIKPWLEGIEAKGFQLVPVSVLLSRAPVLAATTPR